MRDDELVARYPRCYHLAYGPEVWPSIQRHGLLSVAALLDRWEVAPVRQQQLLRVHRPAAVPLTHPVHGTAHLRDQHPLNIKMLGRALTDMTIPDWLEQLNRYVFFAPTMKRLESLYAAYNGQPRLVLTLSTTSLLEAHRYQVRLSRINTGAVRHINHTRGSDTFRRISSYDAKREVAEVAISNSVSDITDHVLRVETWHEDGTRRALE